MSSAVCVALFLVFFFKKETAFEVRISDRSSDLCSSDLFAWHQATYVRCRDGLSILGQEDFVPKAPYTHLLSPGMIGAMCLRNRIIVTAMGVCFAEIGRASCSERVCTYEYLSVAGGTLQKKEQHTKDCTFKWTTLY